MQRQCKDYQFIVSRVFVYILSIYSLQTIYRLSIDCLQTVCRLSIDRSDYLQIYRRSVGCLQTIRLSVDSQSIEYLQTVCRLYEDLSVDCLYRRSIDSLQAVCKLSIDYLQTVLRLCIYCYLQTVHTVSISYLKTVYRHLQIVLRLSTNLKVIERLAIQRLYPDYQNAGTRLFRARQTAYRPAICCLQTSCRMSIDCLQTIYRLSIIYVYTVDRLSTDLELSILSTDNHTVYRPSLDYLHLQTVYRLSIDLQTIFRLSTDYQTVCVQPVYRVSADCLQTHALGFPPTEHICETQPFTRGISNKPLGQPSPHRAYLRNPTVYLVKPNQTKEDIPKPNQTRGKT